MDAFLNSSLHTTIGETPHYVVFGQDKRLPYHILLRKEEPVYNYDDYIQLRSTDFQRIYKRVQSNISEAKNVMNEQQWQSAREKLIAIGDIVYTKVHEPKNKLAPRFEGPYHVVAYDKGNKVKIRHLTTMETKIAHLDHLKRHARSQGQDTEAEPTPCVLPQGADSSEESPNEYRTKLRSYKSDDG